MAFPQLPSYMSGSLADSNGSGSALQPGLGDSITFGQLKSMVPKPKVCVRLVVIH